MRSLIQKGLQHPLGETDVFARIHKADFSIVDVYGSYFVSVHQHGGIQIPHVRFGNGRRFRLRLCLFRRRKADKPDHQNRKSDAQQNQHPPHNLLLYRCRINPTPSRHAGRRTTNRIIHI